MHATEDEAKCELRKPTQQVISASIKTFSVAIIESLTMPSLILTALITCRIHGQLYQSKHDMSSGFEYVSVFQWDLCHQPYHYSICNKGGNPSSKL